MNAGLWGSNIRDRRIAAAARPDEKATVARAAD
ncbi:hypothetical protein FHU38_001542 [Saccharomonospora amisosensis]|uniref:Uncharacterized protein n=1 Tax=Saccharomonospora amisosensis TaxID=1128677 RepID=A0A7X5ZPW4_9PSEU|nr:hypothetical protein [Saccharomonospora amisosensis]